MYYVNKHLKLGAGLEPEITDCSDRQGLGSLHPDPSFF
jgi:hypothetical protein